MCPTRDDDDEDDDDPTIGQTVADDNEKQITYALQCLWMMR